MTVSFRGKYLSLVYMCECVHVCVCRCVCMCLHASGSQKLTDSSRLAIQTAPGICLSLPTRAQYVDAGIWILILTLFWQTPSWPKYLPSPSIPLLKTLFKSPINLWCTSGIWYLCQPQQTILLLLLRATRPWIWDPTLTDFKQPGSSTLKHSNNNNKWSLPKGGWEVDLGMVTALWAAMRLPDDGPRAPVLPLYHCYSEWLHWGPASWASCRPRISGYGQSLPCQGLHSGS